MMEESLRKFRDRLRIVIILYTFCERMNGAAKHFGVFRTEIKIQALDFLLRYPDFLSIELMDLMTQDPAIDRSEIQRIVEDVYLYKEPEIRVEEMEKFFHGAYESIDDVIAFLVSVGFVEHESKKRTDGKKYDKIYYITHTCAEKIEIHLKAVPSVSWYFERCELLKKYFNRFSGTELKARQYQYSEYRDISYRNYIRNVNERVRQAFKENFNNILA